ncbi:MAG: radical SAM protein [Planctomycetota bacterium]|jgi:hypothetical protein
MKRKPNGDRADILVTRCVHTSGVVLNPCELAIELFCRGVETDVRPGARTRAGLGSGLDLVIEGTSRRARPVWMNAPVVEPFVSGTPWRLRENSVENRVTGERYSVRLPEPPAWYEQQSTSGVPLREIGTLQGTYLGVYVGSSCAYWSGDASDACRFCTTGLNVRRSATVDDVIEAARAAKQESGVTFVHLNTGYQGGAAARLVLPYVAALKREVGVLVGVQIAPEAPLAEFDALIDAGADHISFCFEYYDSDAFAEFCPGKAATLGQQAFFRALEHCQARMPRGACSGEIIAGNEPVSATLAAIDYITSVGAFPTVCIFRPLQGSGMEDWPAPDPVDMTRVMRHVWDRCRDRGIPIGMAPNIEVSLVVQPTDAAYLARGTLRDRWYVLRNALLRRMAAPLFRRRMRLRLP